MSEWIWKNLSQIGEIITGSTPDTQIEKYYGGNYPFVGPADINNNKYVCNTIKSLTQSGFNQTRKLPQKSILVTCIGELGKVAIAKKELATNQQLNAIICYDLVDSEFIYYVLKHSKNQLNTIAGLQVVPTVNKKEFGKIEILIPKSKQEQQKIAEILSEIDSAIESAGELVEKEKRIKTALMQDLLAYGIDKNGKIRNPKTHQFKPSPLGDIPQEWDVVRLGKVLTVGNGRDYRHLKTGVYPVYGTGGQISAVDSFLHNGESVCIGRKGTIDNPMLLKGKFWTVDTLFYTHSFIGILPSFLYFIFLGIDWRSYNEASGVPSLAKKTIENIQIKILPFAEQQKIAEILSSQDEKIEKANQKLNKLKSLKAAMMQDLLSGSVRVNHLLGSEQ